MQITARLIEVLPLQSGMGRNGEWKKQDIIVETDGQYPKKICITMWGDKFSNVPLNEGENYTIDFDVESREYNGRWYTDVKAWRIVQQGAGQPAQPNMPEPPSYDGIPDGPEIPSSSGANPFDGMSNDDEMPF